MITRLTFVFHDNVNIKNAITGHFTVPAFLRAIGDTMTFCTIGQNSLQKVHSLKKKKIVIVMISTIVGR